MEETQLALAERDEAVRTKAEIGSRREATAMAKVAIANREVKALKDELGQGATWKATKAISWLTDYLVPSTGMWSVVGRRLATLSKEMGYEVSKVEHQQFGSVNSYHVDVIDELRFLLESDPDYLKKYRKAGLAHAS